MSVILIIILHYQPIFAKNDPILVPRKPYNVILIIIDTLRADHLGCYGYFRNTSPNIDKFANDSILFEQAISQAPWTLPSLSSILTSKYVYSHGVGDMSHKLSDSEVTIAELLKSYGYKTAAFTAGYHVSSTFGFDQGFKHWRECRTPVKPGRIFAYFEDSIPYAIKWLEKNKKNRFFLLLHGGDVHTPYHQPPLYDDIFDPNYKGIVDTMELNSFTSARIYRDSYFADGAIIKLSLRDINHLIAHYDAGIFYADKSLHGFLNKLDKLDCLKNTIIIILADHGECLFDHDYALRHHTLYEEVIHVPLIIKHPQIKGPIRIKTQAQLIDVMPTILDFVGMPKHKAAQGNSLVPLIEGEPGLGFNQYVYAETIDENIKMVRTLKWKLIVSKENQYELYDIETDPREINNLISFKKNIAYKLMQKIYDYDKIMKQDDFNLKEYLE